MAARVASAAAALRTAVAAVAAASVLELLAPAARAQHPQHLLDDAATLRGAIDAASMNLELRRSGQASVHRATLVPGGIDVDGAAWRTDDASLPLELRLVGALFASDALVDTFQALGVALPATLLGLELHDLDGGTTRLMRVGTSEASVALELGTGRPRELVVATRRGELAVVARAYGELGRGWEPTHVEVWEADTLLFELVVRDMARTPADLMALPPTGASAGGGAPRLLVPASSPDAASDGRPPPPLRLPRVVL
jgi:hypothetical protein